MGLPAEVKDCAGAYLRGDLSGGTYCMVLTLNLPESL